MTCKVEKCFNVVAHLGFCGAHYRRFNRYGDPLAGRALRSETPRQRFQRSLPATRTESDCWIWQGSIGKGSRGGYGVFWDGKRNVKAHRWHWEYVNGAIPSNVVIDHLCRNRACVNLAHMELVTGRENTLRGDTIASRNAAKTKCKNGHDLSGNNLKPSKQGRVCRECANRRNREYLAKKRKADEKINLQFA